MGLGLIRGPHSVSLEGSTSKAVFDPPFYAEALSRKSLFPRDVC